jgi:Holliday junction resolvase
MTPEGKVKDEIKKALAARTQMWWFMPIGGFMSRIGVPDFIGVYKGRFFAIEAKAEKGKLTKLQAKTIDAITQCGGLAAVIQPQPNMTITEAVHALLPNEFQ